MKQPEIDKVVEIMQAGGVISYAPVSAKAIHISMAALIIIGFRIMIKLKATYKNEILTIRSNGDGWYIENFGQNWKVFEAQNSGEPLFIGRFHSFDAAYKNALSLT